MFWMYDYLWNRNTSQFCILRNTRARRFLIAMIAVVVCVALATFFVGDIPVAATDAAVSDESQSRGYKSGSTKEPSGIVDSIRAWRSKFLKELDCIFLLNDAIVLDFAAETRPEQAGELVRSLEKDSKAERFLTTWRTWRAVVRLGKKSFRRNGVRNRISVFAW